MKLRTILPLLLLSLTLFAPQGTTRAQNRDWISITTDPFQQTGWRIAFHHFGPDLRAVTALTLTLDTTQFPNVRFFSGGQGLYGHADSQYQWVPFSGIDNNGDSAWWCNSFNSIPHNTSDSFFVFGLQPNPNNQNAQINDSAVTIHWFASFESNGCVNYSPISSGSFQLIPTSYQSFAPFDTMTATTSTPLCDPLFNFTVHNRNGYRSPIGKVTIEFFNVFNGTMRPSDISAPPGWTLVSVTPYTATFSGGNNVIPDGGSQSNFIVGLMASSTATTFDFVLHTYDYQGTFIDRDTTWGIPAKALDCSDQNSSDDTLRISNNLGCAFSFNLENSHAGNVPVSPIDSFVLHITTPNVTWSQASNPAACWSNNNPIGTPTLSWQTPTPSCAQPGGITQAYHASILDPTPGELVTVNWSTFSGTTQTSSGTDTFRCEAPVTPDSVFVEAVGSCCYRLRLKNAHMPSSNIHAVLLEIPGNAGAFSTSCLSSNANWGYSFGSGDTSLQFTAGNNSPLLAPGTTDTFYFSTNPKLPNTPWPLTVIDYETSGNTITDLTINNIPGCTPPVICDTVTFKQSRIANTCVDTMTVVSRAIGSNGVDSVWVIPIGGWKVVSGSNPTPWQSAITPKGDTLIYAGGNVSENTSRVFVLSFNGDTSLHGNFGVLVITHDVNGLVCTSMDSMSCLGTSAIAPTISLAPLTLSIAPNPLRDQTDITLTTGTTDRVRMVLLNVLGQTEQTVVDQMLGAGDHKFTLDATTLAAGTYYLRLETNGQVMTKKIVVEK